MSHEEIEDGMGFAGLVDLDIPARPFRSKPPAPIAAPATDDPTFDIRRKQANLCDATMMRVVELEAEAERLTEIAKKLRAAVVANT